ncbi:protein adenylyltransferase SelO [Microbacterium terricola]|uniref:Protein nucleotidyltransferase YdiU n=1 Tax=Microbacterium terricola TaxID=344163 RepID=A0ABM8E3S8_9MICO|nr:YdiU family protein [Microbacterium terricola]UYK39940.1 YdiU family protein [Microbacterium terricola]BDV32381.1 UPF0061 protein [Microbacterium terricola]
MGAVTRASVSLDSGFARELGELAVPWQAEPVADPRLLVLNEPLAAELALDPGFLRSAEGVSLLVGGDLPDEARPVAQAYAGHQFGGYAPLLGDGRALLLGELTDRHGRPRDLHLKGSGRTPFARGGDGLAAVGPMLREYVISEAMHALGVPTTRSLAVVATGRTVRREIPLPGAVLARVARSHVRVGSFSYAHGSGDPDLLRRLADHAIARCHPDAADAPNRFVALYQAVVSAQADLVAQWMLVGFVHGVMNTDNMTISGETIDYGPCAFLDAFDPASVYSSIDVDGRYAYGNQPLVAQWNLARLAEAMLPILDDDRERALETARESLSAFGTRFGATWLRGMRAKLGLSAEVEDDEVTTLSEELLALMHRGGADYTSTFRMLGDVARGHPDRAADAFGDQLDAAEGWLARWRALRPDGAAMDRVNPVYIPRNHLVEAALAAAAAGDLAPFTELVGAVTSPYVERPGWERFAEGAPAAFGPYTTFCGT